MTTRRIEIELLLFFFLLFAPALACYSQRAFINPTGTYRMTKKSNLSNGMRYGYAGEIRVKLLTYSRVAMSLYVDKGAPSYDQATILDTLAYRNGSCTFGPYPDLDSCRIRFAFTAKGISVSQKMNECGFGAGVHIDGYYRKVSNRTPRIEYFELSAPGS
jgi:hypothetical protein